MFTWTFIKKDWRTLKFNLLQFPLKHEELQKPDWQRPRTFTRAVTQAAIIKFPVPKNSISLSWKFSSAWHRVPLPLLQTEKCWCGRVHHLQIRLCFFKDVKRDWAKWLRLSIIVQNQTPHHLFTGSESVTHTHTGSRQWFTSLYVSSLWLFQPSQLPKLSLPLLSVSPNRLTHVVKRHHFCADLDTFFIVLSA